MEPGITVSLFKEKTKVEFLKSIRTLMGSFHKIHSFKKDDYVLAVDVENKYLFGIALLDAFSSGKVYEEHNLLDIDVYSGRDAKYNKYDVKIKNFIEVNISFEDLAIMCGKTVNDKGSTNIWKGYNASFRKAFYSGEGEEDVMKRLRILIKSLLSVKQS